MASRWLAILCMIAVNGMADEIALVKVGDSWRYLAGTNEPSVPLAAWRSLEFDDSQWAAGCSGFGTTYYYEATTLYGSSFSTFYCRAPFAIDDPAAIQWLTLRIDFTDGFAAFINGIEVARRGLAGEPGEQMPAGARAEPHPYGDAVEIDLSAFRSALNPGQNMFAIQGHRAYGFGGSFMLNPELLANFTRGPLVQNMSSNQVQIIWKTPVPADSTVEFGPAGKLDSSLTDTNLVINHAVTLQNLTPDTDYLYRIASSGGDRRAISPIAAFRTFSTGGPVEFVVVGDTGHGGLPQQRIAAIMAAQKADLVMHVGDVIYPLFAAGQMDQKCFSIYRAQMRGTPFFYAIGNHEYYGGGASFLAEIQQPSNNPSQTKAYYSFDHGDAHFVVLDSVVPYGNGYAPDSPQYRWLEKDLAGSQKLWKFLFFHNTIHSSGPHRQDDYNVNGIPDRIELQDAIGKLASQYGVQMIFTGHDHIYERSKPANGVVTVVSGGGGAALYQFGGKWDEASNQFWSRYNCVKVSVRDNTLKLSALGLEGEVFDEMTLQTAPPPREIYPSAWHSPPLDSRPSNIADGNIPGQKFDFRGTPVPAKSGKNASLGRLWVNNDKDNLYVGLDQVAISGSQNILLFVQSGDTSGRTGMAGLGDGIYNPDTEGAEALDALENLGFTHFAPSIGCILGDSFADGQFRAHGRINSIFRGGQGVFFLKPGFPEVPGILLQQFNRSPQQSALMADRSAHLIALSIPLEPLSLVPGATVRIAAIVANDFDPANGISTMQTLDAGYIGASMAANANGDILMEAVEFRLSRNPFPVLAGLRLEITPPSEGLLRIRWQATPGTQYGLDFFEPGMTEFAPLSAPGLPWTATNTLGICDLEWPRPQALSPMRLFRLRAVR